MNAAAHYDRNKVVEIVHSVISKMEGVSGESMKSLTEELQSLIDVIEKTRNELASARTHDVGALHVPTATDELDAVIGATKGATDVIMGSCEALEKIVAGSPLQDKVTEEVTKIYEACSFQDITGQRIKKVVGVLREVEDKVGHLLTTLGHGDGSAHPLAVKPLEDTRTGDDRLLNGPQLAANAMSQEEIDKLLASFD